jgi:F-type H+-transporting ATPase subunit alpha
MGAVIVRSGRAPLRVVNDDPSSTEQLKSQNHSLLEKMSGGVLTKEIETEMKSVIESHVADFNA